MTPESRAIQLCLAALSCLTPGCAETKERLATEVVVVIDSDLSRPDELASVELKVQDARGQDTSERRTLKLSNERNSTRYSLPLSLSIVPPKGAESSRFRVVATGLSGSGEPIVEQQAIARFQPGKTARLRVFLGRACLDVLCRDEQAAGDDVACSLETSACEPVPRYDELEVIDPRDGS